MVVVGSDVPERRFALIGPVRVEAAPVAKESIFLLQRGREGCRIHCLQRRNDAGLGATQCRDDGVVPIAELNVIDHAGCDGGAQLRHDALGGLAPCRLHRREVRLAPERVAHVGRRIRPGVLRPPEGGPVGSIDIPIRPDVPLAPVQRVVDGRGPVITLRVQRSSCLLYTSRCV